MLVMTAEFERDALQLDAVDQIAAVGHVRTAARRDADLADQRRMALDEVVFLNRELRIGAQRLQKLFGIAAADECHTQNAKSVVAHRGRGFGNVDVHAVDHAT